MNRLHAAIALVAAFYTGLAILFAVLLRGPRKERP